MHNVYLIKDLARITGFSIYTLKYYIKMGLLKEVGAALKRDIDILTTPRLNG